MSFAQKALIVTLVLLDLICPNLADKVMFEEMRRFYSIYLFFINAFWLALIMWSDVFL